jgi:hypothetical protein
MRRRFAIPLVFALLSVAVSAPVCGAPSGQLPLDRLPDLSTWTLCMPLLSSGYTMRDFSAADPGSALGRRFAIAWYRTPDANTPAFLVVIQIRPVSTRPLALNVTAYLFNATGSAISGTGPIPLTASGGPLWDASSTFGQAFSAWATQIGGDPHALAYSMTSTPTDFSFTINPEVHYALGVHGTAAGLAAIC